MLIDAAEAVKIIKRYDDRGLALDEVTRITDGIAKEIEAMPTVDAEPVRHGKWIEIVVAETDTSRLINWECSECTIVVDRNTDNYCPNCGARMDGE